MQFTFLSIQELEDFLKFAGYEKHADRRQRDMDNLREAVGVMAQDGDVGIDVPDAHLTPEERAAAQQTAIGGAAVVTIMEGADGSSAPVQAQGEPAKRKRRTKAEMQADADADAAARADTDNIAAQVDAGSVQADSNAGAAQSQPSDAQAVAATSPIAGANPFDASTSNEPAATAALNEAPAGTTGTLAAIGNEAAGDRGLEPYLANPVDYIALRVAEMGGEFDAREHMKKCVEFIGALGKARYDEAFELAGTSRSVATYTPADCAKHIAALEYLQIRG